MGAKWKFSTQANLELFKAKPEQYAPQYGGYCAYGVAQGYLVKVEPEQFTVREGKLYLNYDAEDVYKRQVRRAALRHAGAGAAGVAAVGDADCGAGQRWHRRRAPAHFRDAAPRPVPDAGRSADALAEGIAEPASEHLLPC